MEAVMTTVTSDPQKMSPLTTTWKQLQENTLSDGQLLFAPSVQAVKQLATNIGLDPQVPTWTTTLQELLSQAALSQDPAIKTAAAGIARSFSILGTWGAFISNDKEEKAFCVAARKVSDLYLRSLARNFLVRFGDWIREKIASLLVRRSILPTEYKEAFRRKQSLPASDEDGFDAVISFGDAGICGETASIQEKVNAKQLVAWESALSSIERLLHALLLPSLSTYEDMARLQMQWRLLTREIDTFLRNEDYLGDARVAKLKNYAWQFSCVKKVLENHLKHHHWSLDDEPLPYIHVRRCLNGKKESDVIKEVQKEIVETGLIRSSDPILVLQVIP